MIIQDYIYLKVARLRDDLLVGTEMMDVVKEIQKCAVAPSLSAARIVAIGSILVREFRKAGPWVLSNIVTRR